MSTALIPVRRTTTAITRRDANLPAVRVVQRPPVTYRSDLAAKVAFVLAVPGLGVASAIFIHYLV